MFLTSVSVPFVSACLYVVIANEIKDNRTSGFSATQQRKKNDNRRSSKTKSSSRIAYTHRMNTQIVEQIWIQHRFAFVLSAGNISCTISNESCKQGFYGAICRLNLSKLFLVTCSITDFDRRLHLPHQFILKFMRYFSFFCGRFSFFVCCCCCYCCSRVDMFIYTL